MAAVGFTVIGTAVALVFPIDRYTEFLYILGSVFSPLIAILLMRLFRSEVRQPQPPGGCFAATLSLAAGIAFYYLIKSLDLPIGSTLTTIVFTAALHYILRRGWQRGKVPGGERAAG